MLPGLQLPQKGTRVIKRVLWDPCWWKGAAAPQQEQGAAQPCQPQVHLHFHDLPEVKSNGLGLAGPIHTLLPYKGWGLI